MVLFKKPACAGFLNNLFALIIVLNSGSENYISASAGPYADTSSSCNVGFSAVFSLNTDCMVSSSAFNIYGFVPCSVDNSFVFAIDVKISPAYF